MLHRRHKIRGSDTIAAYTAMALRYFCPPRRNPFSLNVENVGLVIVRSLALYRRSPKYCTGVNFHIVIPTVDTFCLLSQITTAYLVTPDQQVTCVAYDFPTLTDSEDAVSFLKYPRHLTSKRDLI